MGGDDKLLMAFSLTFLIVLMACWLLRAFVRITRLQTIQWVYSAFTLLALLDGTRVMLVPGLRKNLWSAIQRLFDLPFRHDRYLLVMFANHLTLTLTLGVTMLVYFMIHDDDEAPEVNPAAASASTAFVDRLFDVAALLLIIGMEGQIVAVREIGSLASSGARLEGAISLLWLIPCILFLLQLMREPARRAITGNEAAAIRRPLPGLTKLVLAITASATGVMAASVALPRWIDPLCAVTGLLSSAGCLALAILSYRNLKELGAELQGLLLTVQSRALRVVTAFGSARLTTLLIAALILAAAGFAAALSWAP